MARVEITTNDHIAEMCAAHVIVCSFCGAAIDDPTLVLAVGVTPGKPDTFLATCDHCCDVLHECVKVLGMGIAESLKPRMEDVL